MNYSIRSFLVIILGLFTHTKETNNPLLLLIELIVFAYITFNYLLSHSTSFSLCNKLWVLLIKQ